MEGKTQEAACASAAGVSRSWPTAETYEALVEGLQNALWTLGGVPEARSDNLSAATHELRHSGGRALNARFAEVLAHYGPRSTRIRPGQSHENGAVEQGHYRLKSALAQALVLRGSRDFASVEAYTPFVQEVVAKLNRKVEAKLAEERAYLRPLPAKRVPAYTRYSVRVRKWSTIRISCKTYSVPSRLIGHRVDVHQHADVVEVYYAGRLVERMPRLRGGREHQIDYRHVIWSLDARALPAGGRGGSSESPVRPGALGMKLNEIECLALRDPRAPMGSPRAIA